MRIVLFGPAGAGKGTQAQMLAKRLGLTHISTGHIIRQAIRAGTDVGLKAQKFVRAGKLVPDNIVRDMAEAAIAANSYEQFVLDGYPRTVQQAEWLTMFLEQHDAPLDGVISFMVPDEVIIDRLSKRRVNKITGENYHLDHHPPPSNIDPSVIIQRSDDHPNAIQRRINIYKTEMQPVQEYYKRKGLLVEIDAVGDLETVYQRIEHALQAVRTS